MRLIDADTLKEHKYHSNEDGTPVEFSAWKQGWNDAIDAITNYALTVDAVPVVRCKDCKWYHNANDKYFPRTCDHWSEMFSHYEDWESVDENGFCSWGERREDVSK